MTDFEVSVQDPTVLAEIELYGELVVAATGSSGPLPQQEIDRLLGLASDGWRRSDAQPNRPEM